MVSSATAPDIATPKPLTEQKNVEEALPNDVVWPPSDLYSDEPPLETTLHLRQMMLLLNCLHWLWKDRDDYFAAGNLTVYYSPRKRKSEDFRGPDFFVALDTQPHPRKSWMVWEEDGKYPNVIVELLSDSTAEVDRGLKKRLYAETFRTPEYFWYDPDSQEFEGFALVRGQYQPIEPDASGLMWSDQLQLHLGVYEQTLRFFDAAGALAPTPEEDALVAEQAATAAKQKASEAEQKASEAEQKASEAEQKASEAEQKASGIERALTDEQQRAQQLERKLRELGVDPDQL